MAHIDDAFKHAEELLAKMGEIDAQIEAARNFIGKAAPHPSLPYAPSAKPEKPGPQAQRHPNPFKRPDGSVKTKAELDEDQDRAAAGAGLVPKGQPAPVEQARSEPQPSPARKKAGRLVRQALEAVEAAQALEDSEENEEVRGKCAAIATMYLLKAVSLDPDIFDRPARGFIGKAAASPAKMSFGGDPSGAKMPEVAGRVTQSDLSDNPKFSNPHAVAYAAENAAKVPGSVMHSDASWSVRPVDAIRAQVSQASLTGSQVFQPLAGSEKVAELNRAWGYDAPQLDAFTWKAFGDKGAPGKPDETMTRVVQKPIKP